MSLRHHSSNDHKTSKTKKQGLRNHFLLNLNYLHLLSFKDLPLPLAFGMIPVLSWFPSSAFTLKCDLNQKMKSLPHGSYVAQYVFPRKRRVLCCLLRISMVKKRKYLSSCHCSFQITATHLSLNAAILPPCWPSLKARGSNLLHVRAVINTFTSF